MFRPSWKQFLSAQASESNCMMGYAACTWKKYSVLGDSGLDTVQKCTPLYVYNPLFSVQMPEIPGVSVLYSLCYNISIWGEDECVPFFISPLPASFVPTSHQLKAAVWVVKSYAQSQDTLWEGCHLRVFFACLMNHVYIPNSSSKEPAPVSYYTQGYTEWDFSLNDRAS